MSSREIAELMKKRHDHVLRDIRKLIDQEAIAAPNFGVSEYKDSTGRMLPEYLLDFHATMVLITGYDANRRAAVVTRWREIETGAAVPVHALPLWMLRPPFDPAFQSFQPLIHCQALV